MGDISGSDISGFRTSDGRGHFEPDRRRWGSERATSEPEALVLGAVHQMGAKCIVECGANFTSLGMGSDVSTGAQGGTNGVGT